MLNIDRFVDGSELRQEAFTPTPAQTVFTLAGSPVTSASVAVLVNGIGYELTTDFTVSGNQVTWLDTPFTLDASDSVVIRYVVRE